MNTNFQLANNVSLPTDTQSLKSDYYLKSVKTESGGHVWELRKTSMPSFLKNAFMAISNYFSDQPTYVYKNKLTTLLDMAANPYEKHRAKEHIEVFKSADLTALTHDADFQSFSRAMGMEKNPLKNKLRRALAKAAHIGKGMAEMEKQGVTGKTLSPSYMIEASTRDHLYEAHEYMNEWQKSDTHLNFDDWMRWHHPDAQVQKVKYLTTDMERLPYKLDFQDGKVLRTNVPFDTAHESTEHSGQGLAIFVIDSKGQFYAGSHIRGKFHHSSFLGGQAIMGAGEIQTDATGKIIGLSSKSGHYKPTTEQNLNTLRLLEKAGIDLSTVKFTQLTAEGSLIYNSAKEYLESEGRCPCNGFEAFGIEGTPEGHYTLTLNDKTLSKMDQLEQLGKTIKFLESKFSVASLKYKEILQSGQSVEYPMETYLAKKGNILPSKWEGGQLEFEDDKLKKVVIDPNAPTDNHQHLYFLNLLAMKGVDLSTVEIEKEGKILNGQEYFNQVLAEFQKTH